ncbi:hypothetical protein J4464_06755 [Candidatus Woesearchaeota archaeon]|nr:hypothetical protein [Candidatus Woesearchaeota archaeon]
MFRKKRMVIDGVEIPEDFSGGSIINNVAISPDGTRYAAVTKSRDIVTGVIPPDGRITVDGISITYNRTGRRVHISGGSVQMGSVSASGSIQISTGGLHISSMGGGYGYEIDEGYSDLSKVTLKESTNSICIDFSQDEKVYVRGSTSAQPGIQGGRLFIDGLEGRLSVPQANPTLELDLRTSAGDISGDVAHKGRLRTSAGDITLSLYAPLTVEANTSAGDFDVTGMISEGRGIFSPPNAKPLGTLILETSAGDINVKYVAR